MEQTASISIVGAGPSGLAAGYFLSRHGHQVTVFEKEAKIGGLVKAVDIGGERVEMFYHLLLPSDSDLVELLREIGLLPDLFWYHPRSAIYVGGSLYPFTSPKDILSFPEVSLIERLAMGILVYRARWIRNWDPLDRVSARDWVVRHAGERVYQKVWGALLHSKFDRDAEAVAAAWLWNKFKLRGTSKSANMSSELLGYLRGSFERIYQKLAEGIRARGGEIICSCPVSAIVPREDKSIDVIASGRVENFQKAVVTTAPAEFERLCPSLPPDYRRRLRQVRYKANLCLMLGLRKSLSPYFWILVADNTIPFVALIEHTNFAPLPGCRHHLVYLSRYIDEGEEMYSYPDEKIKDLFLAALRKMFPGLANGDVIFSRLFRAGFAQPVTVTNYLRIVPGYRTPIENLYLASMAQIYPQDRGQSYAVKIAREVSGLIQTGA